MRSKHNKELVPLAKQLRKDMTREQLHLWYDYLRTYPVRFLRQKVLWDYVVDFYCAKAKLVIEIDEAEHFNAENVKKDAQITAFFEKFGVLVIHISNNEINKDFRRVCNYIDFVVKKRLQELD